MIYPSHPRNAYVGRKEGPAGTQDRNKTQISAKALESADHQFQTSQIEVTPGGTLRCIPRRRQGFQKSSSPKVGGGLGHEISTHPLRFSPLRFSVCTHWAL